MITSTYSIAFNFPMDDSRLIVPLTAEVEEHNSKRYYVIKNFKAGSHPQPSLLPNLFLKKKNGRWVHLDSGEVSHLSNVVGKSIELLENETTPLEKVPSA